MRSKSTWSICGNTFLFLLFSHAFCQNMWLKSFTQKTIKLQKAKILNMFAIHSNVCNSRGSFLLRTETKTLWYTETKCEKSRVQRVSLKLCILYCYQKKNCFKSEKFSYGQCKFPKYIARQTEYFIMWNGGHSGTKCLSVCLKCVNSYAVFTKKE